MTNLPKRQKTLLGYFSQSGSGKHNQCIGDSYLGKAQARLSFTTAATAAVQSSKQIAGACSDAAGLRQRQSMAQPDNHDNMLPAFHQCVRCSVRQPEPDMAQHSEAICSASQSSTSTDGTDGITDLEADAVNQYEQQVQQHRLFGPAQALHQTCC